MLNVGVGDCDVSPPPAFPFHGPVAVAHVCVALCQQKCLWKGEPVLRRGLPAFVKDEKTKPNTVKLLENIFQGTEHCECSTWENMRWESSTMTRFTHTCQTFQHTLHRKLINWLNQEMVIGSGKLASCPLCGYTKRSITSL